MVLWAAPRYAEKRRVFLSSAAIHLFIVALAKPDYDAAKGVTATAPSDGAERRGRAATETASLLLGSAEVLSAKAANSHTKGKLALRAWSRWHLQSPQGVRCATR